MELKYNVDYIKELCEAKDLEFVGVSYKNFDKKRRCVDFICNKHRSWGVQTRPVENLQYKQPCQYCNHKILKKNFKEEVYKINPFIEVIEEYVHSDNPIKCRCIIHDYEWSPIARSLLYGEGCPICGKSKSWDSRGRIITEIFKERMSRIDSNIEIIGEYKGSHEYIRCRCKIHGTEWESFACNIQNQSAKCPTCSEYIITHAQLLSNDEFKERIHKMTPHVVPVTKYTGIFNTVTMHCLDHDVDFDIIPHNYLKRNGGKGCPLCSQSIGERRLITLLLQSKKNISTQHIFKDCVYKKSLRFDAYDLDNNVAYEYQGQQHYYPVNFDGNKEKARREFEVGLKRDEIKREYCKQNNITLVTIPYWDLDIMEQYII